ncbi:Ref family recombination enhancement nuclease [Undibacterium arcticum]|uniref:Ref family recombination enhancement nuclease n=1 Tax=Undibacterium arcticum TaxID=1762892 RepID=A0ABV7F0R1_9BURK
MNRSPMKRSPFTRVGILAQSSFQRTAPARKVKLKSKQRGVTVNEQMYWDRLASEIGCVACRIAGRQTSNYVSIHHIDGRTKPGCHSLVLPLCAGCHQQGTGNDKTLVAIHPNKSRFEKLYGSQLELKAKCDAILGVGK